MTEMIEGSLVTKAHPGVTGRLRQRAQRLSDYIARRIAFGYPETATINREWTAITEPLLPEHLHDPTEVVAQWVKLNCGRGVVVYGENWHHSTGPLAYEPELVEALQGEFGLTTVFLEEDERQMRYVWNFYQTGVMPRELRLYLREGFVRQDCAPHNYKVSLLEKCHRLSVPVVFIDRNEISERDRDWEEKIARRIGKDLDGLYLLIVGATHAYHTETRDGLPTIVSLLDRDYKDKILSVWSIGIDNNEAPPAQEIIHNRLIHDLGRLGRLNQRQAFYLKGSPYEGRLIRAASPVIASEAYDVVMTMPGRNLGRRY